MSAARIPNREKTTVSLQQGPTLSCWPFPQLHRLGRNSIDVSFVNDTVTIDVHSAAVTLLDAASQRKRIENIYLAAAIDIGGIKAVRLPNDRADQRGSDNQ